MSYMREEMIRDLSLYIPNTRLTYIMFQAMKRGIKRAQLKGIYDADKALRAVTRMVTTACKLYTIDIDHCAHAWNILFPLPDRKAYAAVLLDEILATLDA